MPTHGITEKIKWLQSIGFSVASLEDGSGWIAKEHGGNMSITLTNRSALTISDTPYSTTGWMEMRYETFQWNIRSYMLEINGTMTFNEEELQEARLILSHHHAFDLMGGLR